MNSISKVSDITTNDLAEYIRLVEVSKEDENTLSNLLKIWLKTKKLMVYG